MDISNITSASLNSLIKLVQTRESLLSELKKVEDAIAATVGRGGESAAVAVTGKRRGRKAGKASVKAARPVKASRKSAKSGKRGALKEQILSALKASGAKGVSVKDLSSQLGVKSQNIHVWFATTGKTSGAVKVAPGVYRLKA